MIFLIFKITSFLDQLLLNDKLEISRTYNTNEFSVFRNASLLLPFVRLELYQIASGLLLLKLMSESPWRSG